MTAEDSQVCVVIPTYNRPDQIARAVAAVLAQEGAPGLCVIVANDGTVAVPDRVRHDTRVSVVDGPFGGPAAARNAGIARARGDIVVFTDDDTVPRPGWLRAALGRLAAEPSAVGVVGLVECPALDPLYEYAVSGEGVGNFLTCNVAYRRWALDAAGGFDEGFPYPHCEDRDLGHRVSKLGPIVYEATMVVDHPARSMTVGDVARRGRLITSEWRLYRKHPELKLGRWPVRWTPAIAMALRWQRAATRAGAIQGKPARALRLVALATGEMTMALWTTLTEWARELRRGVDEAVVPDGQTRS